MAMAYQIADGDGTDMRLLWPFRWFRDPRDPQGEAVQFPYAGHRSFDQVLRDEQENGECK